jgi:hypothetical protein
MQVVPWGAYSADEHLSPPETLARSIIEYLVEYCNVQSALLCVFGRYAFTP